MLLSQNISQKNTTDIMVLLINYKYDNPQSLLRVILCQINRFENNPLREDIWPVPKVSSLRKFYCLNILKV